MARFAFAVFVLALPLPLPLSGSPSPSVVYIDPLGDDATGDGSAANPFRTLQKAADTVDPAGTVFVRPGSYPFLATLTRPMRVVAAGPGAVLGPAPLSGALVAVSSADDVSFVGLRFQGSAISVGLRFAGGSNRGVVEDCEFVGFGQGGVRVEGPPSSGHRLTRARFQGIRRGSGGPAVAVYASASAGLLAEDCRLSDCDRGVELVGSAQAVLRRLRATDLRQSAVLANDSADLLLEDSQITRCAWFPAPAQWYFASDEPGAVALTSFSHRAVVRGTVVEDCGGYTGKNTFRAPALPRYDGLFAVGILDCTQVRLEGSTLARNRFGGVYLGGLSSGLVLTACNLVANGSDNDPGKDTALFLGGQSVNAANNFWGMPSGPFHDNAGPGNGIDGAGSVVTAPASPWPFPSAAAPFVETARVPTGARARAVAAGDFTGDGRADLALAHDDDGMVATVPQGPAGFLPRITAVVGGRPVALATGQFNGDAFLDLAVVDEVQDRVLVLLGDGTGAFPDRRVVAVPRRPQRLRAAPLDAVAGDELVVCCPGDAFGPGGVAVLRNDGAASFARSDLAGLSVPSDVEVLDLDGNGRLDLVAFDRAPGGPSLRRYLNDGGAGFGAPASTSAEFHPVVDATLVCCNVDGGPEDLAVASFTLDTWPGTTHVRVLRGSGLGTLLPAEDVFQDFGPVTVRAAAFGATGRDHLVLVNPALSVVRDLGPFHGSPAAFVESAATVLGAPVFPLEAGVGDVTGDLAPDLLVADGAGLEIRVLRGQRPGALLLHGTGCPGTSGVPRMRAQSTPVLGASTFAVAFENGAQSSAGVLVLGALPASLPLPGGCTLLVDLIVWIRAAASDGTGFGYLPLPIPEDRSLVGGAIFCQWFVVDANGALNGLVSATEGVRVDIGG